MPNSRLAGLIGDVLRLSLRLGLRGKLASCSPVKGFRRKALLILSPIFI
jgi:hypothetical protein